MQGVRDALFAFTIKFECLEKHLERRIEQQVEKFEQQLHKTEAKINSAVRHCMAELTKQQTHKGSRISWQLSRTYCIPQLSMISALYHPP